MLAYISRLAASVFSHTPLSWEPLPLIEFIVTVYMTQAKQQIVEVVRILNIIQILIIFSLWGGRIRCTLSELCLQLHRFNSDLKK